MWLSEIEAPPPVVVVANQLTCPDRVAHFHFHFHSLSLLLVWFPSSPAAGNDMHRTAPFKVLKRAKLAVHLR